MTLKQINYSLYKSAEHLVEAGKYMMVFNRERGLNMLKEADMILSVIQLEEEKVPREKLESIMNEIMNIKVGT